MPYHRCQNWAVLACGPSLYDHWSNDHYDLYDCVLAINQAGKHFWHDVLFHLDSPDRIFQEKGRRVWEMTLGQVVTSKCKNCDWGFTFPNALEWTMRNSPEGAKIHLYGWDCNGIKPVENAQWVERRTEGETKLVLEINERHPGKLTQVFGKMREWAINQKIVESPLAPLAPPPTSPPPARPA